MENNDYKNLDQADEALRNEYSDDYTDNALSGEIPEDNNVQTEPVPAVEPDNVISESERNGDNAASNEPVQDNANLNTNIDITEA